jgi:inner membrane protein YhjD
MTRTTTLMTRARDKDAPEEPSPAVEPLGSGPPSTGAVATVKKAPARGKAMLEGMRARYGAVDVIYRTFKRYSEDDAGSYAAALTYYTFFAIFPLLLFGAAMLGYLTFGNEELKQKILFGALDSVPFIRDALQPDGLKIIQANRSTIAYTGLALALYTGTGMLVALGHALDRIHRVDNEGNFFQKRVRAVKWLALLGLAAIGSFTMTGVAGFAPGVLSTVLSYLAGIAVNVFIFTTAFKFLPAKRLTWGEVWPGAVIAALGFELLKTLGAIYLTQGESARHDTFGTLAAAATLLVAAYLISQVTLLAAEVNAALAERRETRVLKARTEEAT